MSYYHRINLRVTYSSTVSYGPSENGGSISVNDSGMIPVDILVDTDSFDARVVECCHTVDGLTSAVVAAKTAQVESKREASRKIASTIVEGFFNYVGADLSQKVKELTSQIEALLVSLLGHKESCCGKRKQMQDDYNRISKRYSKVFDDLDREMASRISVLDKPVFQFVDNSRILSDRVEAGNLLGMSTVSADEAIRLEAVMESSLIRRQASGVIDQANNYLQGTYLLSNSVKKMLSHAQSEAEVMLPVMYVESVEGLGRNKTEILGGLQQMQSASHMKSQINDQFRSSDISWDNMSDEDFAKVRSYFNSYVQGENMDDRIQDTMLHLLENNSIKTIKA